MVTPSNAAYRAAARQTWLNDAIKHATTKFVAGDVPCSHRELDREVTLHNDIVFVQSDDCKKWHSPAKIHAWYTYAIKEYPQAIWIAKMEDDGLCAPERLKTRQQNKPPLSACWRALALQAVDQGGGDCAGVGAAARLSVYGHDAMAGRR